LHHGRIELRSALAAYLGRARGVRLDPAQVLITAGTTQSLSLLFTTLAQAGRGSVAMEDPGFGFHRRIARHAGMTVLPLPVDADGAQPESLRETDPSAVMVTPANQYPTGVTMHPSRRSQLIEWAVAADGLVIEDDYDSEFRYDRKPIGALQGTAPDRVAYLGSVSKTLGPGLRLGWMVLPNRLLAPVARSELLTTHGTDVTSQLTLARFLETHLYDRHIRAMRSRYRRRHELLTTTLHELSSPRHRYVAGGTSAGGQAAVVLPDHGPDDDDVVALAAAEGLGLQTLRAHWHNPASGPKGLLVGFSRPPDRAYPAAIALLAGILRRCYG
jgi:GntR family transcriptional regulator/MocR family aminotransferase